MLNQSQALSLSNELQSSGLLALQQYQETILDHQIHNGSFSYSLILTDQGNIHIYSLFEGRSMVQEQNLSQSRLSASSTIPPFDPGYRGTLKVPRGALHLCQDTTGLYLGVVAPSFVNPSYRHCDSSRDRINSFNYFDAEHEN